MTEARTSRLQDRAADKRPRERRLRLGADALTDAELVALLIGSGTAGRNVVEVAGDVLRASGGAAGLLSTSAAGMTNLPASAYLPHAAFGPLPSWRGGPREPGALDRAAACYEGQRLVSVVAGTRPGDEWIVRIRKFL